MTKAIICGYYGQENAGDEALLLSILSNLPKTIKPIVLSANPLNTSHDYGVESYNRIVIIWKILQLDKNDIFIWGGGSLIQDVTSIKSPIYYLMLMTLAQWKGLKTVAYSQGIGPINSKIIQWLTKIVLRQCTKLSVRDKQSLALLKEWGIKCLIAPDPVWSLKAKIKENLSLSPHPRIAINLRSHPELTSEKIEIIVKSLILLKQETKSNILLVPFQPSKDLEMCEKVKEKLGEDSEIIYLKNPQELKGLFSQVEMLIGMRLHSLIMAKSEGCRCFALSYDPKVTALMREYDIDGYNLTDFPEDENVVVAKWLKTYQQPENVNKDERESLAKSALQHQELILSLIKEK